jgi:hypothetical protein
MPATASAFASGASSIHWCRRSPTPSPSGRSALWFGPATKPSTDIAMLHVILLM